MFLDYNQPPLFFLEVGNKKIASFEPGENIDPFTVKSFGEEWLKFNSFKNHEIEKIGNEYFDICSNFLSKDFVVLDVGCGTGRWSKFLADKVKVIEAIDPGNAVIAAANLLSDVENIRITKAGVSNIPFNDNSFDLVISLGVLHHIPDTAKAMKDCVSKLKTGGYFLVYLYYSLDNRGFLYKTLFKISNFFRQVISLLPPGVKKFICDLIALFVYMPFVWIGKFLNRLGLKSLARKLPLSYYIDKTFFVMRNDSLDRFGTPLEQRFSKEEIKEMMLNAGLTNIVFSDKAPYWHAVGKKA